MAGNPTFGKRIRELREAKRATDRNFTLRKFAEAAEMSATYLSKVERGQFDPPAPAKIKNMARLLDVDADDLLALAGRVDPELNDIIREQSTVLPDLLRTVRGMSEEQLRKLTAQAEQARDKKQ